MKMSYIVYVPELHYQRVIIEAQSPHHARQLVQEGNGIFAENEYKRTLEKDEVRGDEAWQVELMLI